MIIQSAERETNKSFNSVHNGKKNVLSYEKELTERFSIIPIYQKSEIFKSQMSMILRVPLTN